METPRTTGHVHGSSRGPLTVIAVLLGFLVLDRGTSPAGKSALGPSSASAQVRSVTGGGGGAHSAPPGEEESSDGRVNPADQRKQMITELRSISQRLDRIEAVLSKGLSVKVTDMPEMRLPKALEAKLSERSGN